MYKICIPLNITFSGKFSLILIIFNHMHGVLFFRRRITGLMLIAHLASSLLIRQETP